MLFGQEHVDEYRRTGGEVGHEWRPGVWTLLLTTRGRRSGKAHTVPLIYGRDGDDYVIVASKGGADEHPDWYRNLQADPVVELQVGSEIMAARARTATAAERERLWPMMAEIWPDYDAYARKTERTIPVVVLEPEPSDG